MVRLTREVVADEALGLLDEVGLDQVSTRALAQRLGVKQPSLYWHFSSKEALLSAMATAAMAPHAAMPLPTQADDWREWFVKNTESFRRCLLLRRDGARLHAGSQPAGAARERSEEKIDFLVRSGLDRGAAEMAMLAASRFTVGSVLEQQAEQNTERDDEVQPDPRMDHDAAFRSGLAFIVAGLAEHHALAQPAAAPGIHRNDGART